MNEKYCPKGNCECKCYCKKKISNPNKDYCNVGYGYHYDISSFEVCPWPSKQEPPIKLTPTEYVR